MKKIKKQKEQMITIIDKKVPYSLFESYLRIMWTFVRDEQRGKSHMKIFEALGVDRYNYEEMENGKTGMDYENAIDDVICIGFTCHGQTVLPNNMCRDKDCNNVMDVNQGIIKMRNYCEANKWKING